MRDRNGQALSCVYFKDEYRQPPVATPLTRDEARHLAAAVAKLLEPWRMRQTTVRQATAGRVGANCFDLEYQSGKNIGHETSTDAEQEKADQLPVIHSTMIN